MKLNTLKKYFCLFLIFLFLVIIPIMPVLADDPESTSTSVNGYPPSTETTQQVSNDAMSGIMESLGIDSEELNYGVQTMNASRQKQTAPQVTLTFTPSNPQTGNKITATATPMYFIGDLKNQYFTWFLEQKGCEQDEDPGSEKKAKCDLNGDDKIDIEDYKIRAMRTLANNDFSWQVADYDHSDGKSEHNAIFGGTDQKGKAAYCYVQDVASGNAFPLECDSHLFANAPDESTGDNSFGRNEEKFWHTDPTSADTAQTGNTDEATVAGLGMNALSWNYTAGDKVGVVVEGASIEPSQTRDASYRTMWAAPNGLCSGFGIEEDTWTNDDGIEETALHLKKNGETLQEITKVSDLNNCLYENLVAPSENSQASNKLEVALTYSPTSPINDPATYDEPSLSNGDELTIQSSVSNPTDSAYLQYSWEVFASDEPNPDEWGDPIPKSSLPDATQMEGLGITSFKFKLNLAEPKKYFNVKLTVKEASNDYTREGHASVLIPLSSNANNLHVFATSISDTAPSGLSAPYISMADEICTSATESALCPINKNEIVGLNVDSSSLTDFLWTIDGTPFAYKECFFDNCDINKQTNVAYFPALKEVGESYTVALTALNKETGEKVNLSKMFKVTAPGLSISSADENVCKPVLLGNYIDLDGKSWPDYSETNFWGLADSSIKLQTKPASSFVTWVVDGQTIVPGAANSIDFPIDETGAITLPAKGYGESYTVSASALYAQGILVKTALNKYWGASYDDFYEKNLSSTINIDLQDSTSTVASVQAKKILATIYSGTPAYLAFLLRIALVAFLILFSSQLTLSFFPRTNSLD